MISIHSLGALLALLVVLPYLTDAGAIYNKPSKAASRAGSHGFGSGGHRGSRGHGFGRSGRRGSRNGRRHGHRSGRRGSRNSGFGRHSGRRGSFGRNLFDDSVFRNSIARGSNRGSNRNIVRPSVHAASRSRASKSGRPVQQYGINHRKGTSGQRSGSDYDKSARHASGHQGNRVTAANSNRKARTGKPVQQFGINHRKGTSGSRTGTDADKSARHDSGHQQNAQTTKSADSKSKKGGSVSQHGINHQKGTSGQASGKKSKRKCQPRFKQSKQQENKQR